MDANEYQRRAMETAVYPRKTHLGAILYCALGLAGEIGELVNEAKRLIRDDQGKWTLQRRARMIEELGDILWYVAALCHEHEKPMNIFMPLDIEVDTLQIPANGVEAALYLASQMVVKAGYIHRELKDGILDRVRGYTFRNAEMVQATISVLMRLIIKMTETLDTSLGHVMEENLRKLEDRARRNVVKGEGDNR